MKTTHRIILGDARRLQGVKSESVHLVVTSPPYPMIEMWDGVFSRENPRVAEALDAGHGPEAFERMHRILDGAWDEVFRVLTPGGFACINIGDATRTIKGRFALYPNHARILTHCLALGFTNLPGVIWRKQTNAPNKFMGSGVLPAGAYVTLEHEFILILRKGERREFRTAGDRRNRMQSSLFWEERNAWFSDVWLDLKGTGQDLNRQDARKRSAAFPFELPYRLINMFSVRGDTVLDPFLGIGTTTLAAMASMRGSIGVEIDASLRDLALMLLTGDSAESCNRRIGERLQSHLAFVRERDRKKGIGAFKYRNRNYGFPVMMKPETEIVFNCIGSVARKAEDEIEVTYRRGGSAT